MATTKHDPITLVIGKPSVFALTFEHGVTLPDNFKSATPAPFYGKREADTSDDDWQTHKDALRIEAEGKQSELLMSIARAHAAGVDVTVIVAEGATNYGDGIYSPVANPDYVADFIRHARKAGVTVIDCEAQESARLVTGV